MNNGFMATKILKTLQGEDAPQEIAFGQFVAADDYFEKEKQRMMREFKRLSIDDDLRALHKEYLV